MTAAVQPTLDFLNTYFRAGADNSLQILRNAKIIGSAIVNGSFNVNGDTVLLGNFYCRTRTGNGFVITPGPGTNPTFYITNYANNDALVLVDATGNLSAVSLSSRAGIKQTFDVGNVWNTSATNGGYYGTQKCVFNIANSSFGSTPYVKKFTHPGSIVGWTINNAGPDLGVLGLRYYRNGTLIANPLTSGGGGNNATFWGTHGKGVYAFAAGDTLTVTLGCSANGNFQCSAELTVEMAG